MENEIPLADLEEKKLSSEEIKQKINYAKNLIEAYKKDPNLDISKVYANLKAIKSILESCKGENQAHLAQASYQLTEYLSTAEAHETVRIERWADGVKCPYCKSDKIQLLAEQERKLHDYYRYLCTACQQQFNDATESPLSSGIPSIEVWMEVWYLYGCNPNMTYIAAKLNLDLHTVKFMISQLQKLFNTQQPATKLEEKFDSWQNRFSALAKSIKENILEKTAVLYGKDTVHQAKDTAEYRRQRERKFELNIKPKL